MPASPEGKETDFSSGWRPRTGWAGRSTNRSGALIGLSDSWRVDCYMVVGTPAMAAAALLLAKPLLHLFFPHACDRVWEVLNPR